MPGAVWFSFSPIMDKQTRMNIDATLLTLTAPLEGTSGPCGPDMVFSAEFDQLNELRRQDDPTIDQGEWVTELKRADWPAAMALAEQLLAKRTKDLRLAAWWAEAAAHVKGFAGLADGLDLYTALCRAHWAQIHPVAEDGDHELRIGSTNWLLTQTRALCSALPVMKSGDLPISLTDIDTTRQRAPSAAAAAASGEKPAALTMDMVTRAQRATPAAHILALLEGARRLPEAVAQLQAVVDEHWGAEAPGFASTRDAVRDTAARLERLAREMGALPSAAASLGEDGEADADSGPSDAAGVSTGAPGSRAQALAQLRAVAAFFRRTEPHSPVAYLADRAARWGEMPLHEWLRAVLKEQGTLAQIEELLGVEPKPPTDAA
jgi:type VI secretion system protein ImpA